MLLILQIAAGIWLGAISVIITIGAYMEAETRWQRYKNSRYKWRTQ